MSNFFKANKLFAGEEDEAERSESDTFAVISENKLRDIVDAASISEKFVPKPGLISGNTKVSDLPIDVQQRLYYGYRSELDKIGSEIVRSVNNIQLMLTRFAFSVVIFMVPLLIVATNNDFGGSSEPVYYIAITLLFFIAGSVFAAVYSIFVHDRQLDIFLLFEIGIRILFESKDTLYNDIEFPNLSLKKERFSTHSNWKLFRRVRRKQVRQLRICMLLMGFSATFYILASVTIVVLIIKGFGFGL